MWVLVWSATRSANTSDSSVYGHPSTESSDLMPSGTPPKGSDGSAVAATARARSSSTWTKAFSSLALMAARVASSSSSGERSLARKASTSEQASPSQGASVMAADCRGRRRTARPASSGGELRWRTGATPAAR